MHGVIPVSGDRGTADAVIPQRGSAVTAPAPTAAYCSAPAGGNRIEADGTTVLRFRGDASSSGGTASTTSHSAAESEPT